MTFVHQIVSARLFPPLASRFLAYGSRASTPEHSKAPETNEKRSPQEAPNTSNTGSLDFVASLKVPHNWFTSFYIVSVAASIFWAPQLFFKSGLVSAISAATPGDGDGESMTLHQVMVVWAVMLAQGSRRLYESIVFARPSSAQMWIGHWALGIWFYMTMSVAIWIEGMRMYSSSSLREAA